MSKGNSALKDLPFFSGLGDRELSQIASIGIDKEYEKGDTIFCEAESLRGLFILKEGLVKIYKLSPEGKEQILHFVYPGETFAGAPIFLKKAHYPASAECEENSTVVMIPREDLFGLIKTNSAFALKVLESFSMYLNDLVSLVEDLSLRDVAKRLAKFLLELAQKGKATNEGLLIETNLTKTEIASRLGTVREVVSRTLSMFQAKGLIKLKGKTILIVDKSRLSKLVIQ